MARHRLTTKESLSMRRFLACGLPLLLLASGCSGFSYEGTLTIARGETYAEAEFKPARESQKLAISVTSEQPVSVYAVLADDKADAAHRLRDQKEPRVVLDSTDAATDNYFLLEVPAGKGLILFVVRKKAGDDLEVKLAAKSK
jgi:hypothetical protein